MGENSEILTSKDLMEVFQILGSDEELFLQDPEILVPRDIQNCQKGEENLSLFEIPEQSSLADKRWSSLFRRKDAPQDVKECKASDLIFILKPRSVSFSSPDTGNKCGSSPDSHLIRNKIQNERNSSHFFVSEIKRKLKQAIIKEQREGGFGEGFPKNVPTKDHFFLKRMTKPSISHNDEDKRQRVCNIYTEAKKHLSEMLNNGDLNANSTSSPGRRWEKKATAHRKSASADFINVVNIKRETQPEDPMKNALCKEPDTCIESLQPTATEPAVDIKDGTAAGNNIVRLSVMIINEIEEASTTLVGDSSKAEAHDEQRDGIISKQITHEESQPPLSSSVASPSHCLAKSEECKSFEARVQPWCIYFDEKILQRKVGRIRTKPSQVTKNWCLGMLALSWTLLSQTLKSSI